MALLRLLRGFEVQAGLRKVGAGILEVGVQEEAIEIVRKVVMMGDVAAGEQPRVSLRQPVREGPASAEQRTIRKGADVSRQELEQIPEGSALQMQRAVDVGFAQVEIRVERQL